MDWALNGAVAFLAMVSFLAIASAKPAELGSQVVAFGIGLVLMAIFAGIDWRSAGAHRSLASEHFS